jgi:hypothetical protein
MEHRSGREFEVELPVGYVDADGRPHRKVHLRKMTGQEEALLADKKLRQNGARLVTEVLASCVRQLGDISPVTRPIISQLSSPDRNFLLLELRKVTFGQELESTYVCPSCAGHTTMVQDLETLPLRRLNGEYTKEIVVELEDGYEDKGGEVHTTMVFRLPTGEDEERTASTVKENASQGMNALLTRCLTGLGTMPAPRREALGTKLISDLTMSDRARIERTMRAEMPGVDMTQKILCENCGRSFQSSLDLTRFFSLPQTTSPSYAGRSSR